MKTIVLSFAILASLGCAQHSQTAAKHTAHGKEYKWPDAAPPDKSGPFESSFSENGVPYHRVETSPGKWQWQIDEKIQKDEAEYEDRRNALWQALQTRPLTDKELAEAEAYGDYLNVQPMVSYSEEEKTIERQNAFLNQYKMRLLAEQAKHGAR